MESLIMLIVISVIAYIIEKKISLRASFMFMATVYIGVSYLIDFALKSSIEQGEMGLMEYKGVYWLTYVLAFIGLGYLLPVMMGAGKRKKPLEKENE